MTTNGQCEPATRINYPPTVPPAAPPHHDEPSKDELQAPPGGFFADLFCWWRTRRERQLIERIRRLQSDNALLSEENRSLGLLVEKLNRWNEASAVTAARIAGEIIPGPRRER